MGKSHGSPNPASGTTQNRREKKLKQSILLPALASSQLISVYQEKVNNALFQNPNYTNYHLEPHCLPGFNEERAHFST